MNEKASSALLREYKREMGALRDTQLVEYITLRPSGLSAAAAHAVLKERQAARQVQPLFVDNELQLG